MSHSSKTDYLEVTEVAGTEVSHEQIQRMHNRYVWAMTYCRDKDVVELGCGTGQGLGILSQVAKSIVASDVSEAMIERVKGHYGERIEASVFNAESMPFEDHSKDVIILFEALYYIENAEAFVKECARVLRPGGYVLVATANKDLDDFNPSPYTYTYFGAKELPELFSPLGFNCQVFAGTSVGEVSLRQKVLRPVKKAAVKYDLMPKTMTAKKLLKRFVFGGLTPMPAELKLGELEVEMPKPISSAKGDRDHKVIFCAAQLKADH